LPRVDEVGIGDPASIWSPGQPAHHRRQLAAAVVAAVEDTRGATLAIDEHDLLAVVHQQHLRAHGRGAHLEDVSYIHAVEDALGRGAVGREDSQARLIAVVGYGGETLAIHQPGHQAVAFGVHVALLDDRALPGAQRDRLATNG